MMAPYDDPHAMMRPIEILLVEDNHAQARLTAEAFSEGHIWNNLTVMEDGEQALSFLYKRDKYAAALRPDLILLDLNLPRKDGRAVLREIKADESLRRIPVVVLTTSEADLDVLAAYDLHANCYISKPVDLDQFMRVIKSIEDFWLALVKLPPP